MYNYQHQFIEFILQKNAIRFGEFTLKSGRISPYFFNSGLVNTGKDLSRLGNFYAAAIEAAKLKFDILFGPAYKGIPLVCTTAISYATQYNKDVPYAFNRKEIKDHGEGGNVIGTDIHGKKILLIDDVITAGTAIQESIKILQNYHAQLVGVVIAFNRQEHGNGESSAIQEVEIQYKVPVISIISFENLIEYLQPESKHSKILKKMLDYKQKYGI